MGLSLLKFYKEKINSVWKSTFFSTFIIGLLVHIYKFTNNLPIHDSLTNYYSSQNIIGSGRWFLSIACSFSSYFDLPWVIGLFTVVFIALTAVVVVDIYKVENPVLGAIIGGLLVSFPAMTEILYFEYTADGYALAMLLAALGVRFSLVKKRKFLFSAISAICVCLTCAIYQSYVSFGMMLVIGYFILAIFADDGKIESIKKFILKQVGIYAAGLVLFWVIWKILLVVENAEINDYQGINELGFSAYNIINGIVNSSATIIQFFFEKNPSETGLSLYYILNIIFLVLFVAVLVICTKRTRIHKKKGKYTLLILALLCMPSAICIWYYSSMSVGYGTRMLHSASVILIIFALLCEKYLKDTFKNIVCVLLVVIIANYGIMANIGYYYMDKMYESTYASALEMLSDIRDIDEADGITQICAIGSKRVSIKKAFSEEINSIYPISGLISKDLIYDGKRFVRFANHTFNCEYELVSDEKLEELKNNAEVLEMEAWPSKNSIKVVDNTIVIVFNENFKETEEADNN